MDIKRTALAIALVGLTLLTHAAETLPSPIFY